MTSWTSVTSHLQAEFHSDFCCYRQEESLRHLSWILIAKQAYVEGHLETAAVFLENAELPKFEFSKPHDPRTLRLVAEGLAITGKCGNNIIPILIKFYKRENVPSLNFWKI